MAAEAAPGAADSIPDSRAPPIDATHGTDGAVTPISSAHTASACPELSSRSARVRIPPPAPLKDRASVLNLALKAPHREACAIGHAALQPRPSIGRTIGRAAQGMPIVKRCLARRRESGLVAFIAAQVMVGLAGALVVTWVHAWPAIGHFFIRRFQMADDRGPGALHSGRRHAHRPGDAAAASLHGEAEAGSAGDRAAQSRVRATGCPTGFAQMAPAEKHRWSHRAAVVRALLESGGALHPVTVATRRRPGPSCCCARRRRRR